MSKYLKQEYKLFMKDIEDNIKNKEDLEYVKQRVGKLLDVMLKDLDSFYDRLVEKEEQLAVLENKHETLEEKVKKIQLVLDNIENDIYAEEGFDFEIVCPYCTGEFFIDMDENKTEIKCPECNNIIELDWSGDIENDEHSACGGGCSHCEGSCQEEEEKDDDDDM